MTIVTYEINHSINKNLRKPKMSKSYVKMKIKMSKNFSQSFRLDSSSLLFLSNPEKVLNPFKQFHVL